MMMLFMWMSVSMWMLLHFNFSLVISLLFIIPSIVIVISRFYSVIRFNSWGSFFIKILILISQSSFSFLCIFFHKLSVESICLPKTYEESYNWYCSKNTNNDISIYLCILEVNATLCQLIFLDISSLALFLIWLSLCSFTAPTQTLYMIITFISCEFKPHIISISLSIKHLMVIINFNFYSVYCFIYLIFFICRL